MSKVVSIEQDEGGRPTDSRRPPAMISRLIETVNQPTNAIEPVYQILTRALGSSHIPSSGVTPKA